MPSVRRALALLLLSGLSTCGGSSNPAALITMSLTLQSCQVPADVSIKCGNGAIRDIQIVAGAFTGTVIDTRIEGTEDETWNTFVSGTTTATGPMVINGKFDIYRH